MTPLLAQSFAIAALVWGQPTCGTPGVTYNAGLPIDALGYVDPRVCRIELQPEPGQPWDAPARRCTTIVHEWGHLTGHAHSTDPDNVMYPTQTRPYWRCTSKWRSRFGG